MIIPLGLTLGIRLVKGGQKDMGASLAVGGGVVRTVYGVSVSRNTQGRATKFPPA